jgi:hypothetical protein
MSGCSNCIISGTPHGFPVDLELISDRKNGATGDAGTLATAGVASDHRVMKPGTCCRPRPHNPDARDRATPTCGVDIIRLVV